MKGLQVKFESNVMEVIAETADLTMGMLALSPFRRLYTCS